jgi:hypothetical protein
MMSSTVVKKDTASRKRYGSSRAEINEETLLRSSTVVNEDREPIMSHSTVVKKDTASRKRYGSSRAEINEEMNMRRSTVLQQDAPILYMGSEGKRGFQHVYKSNTSSSRRVQTAYKNMIDNGRPRSKLAVRRDKKKRMKIQSLTVVAPSPGHSLSTLVLQNSRPIFYTGTVDDTDLCKKRIPNSISLSVTEHLQVVDTTSGARLMNSCGGDIVFTLIPRQYAIQKIARVNETLMALYALEDTQTVPQLRGKTRIPVPEDDGKYVTVGLKPNRNSTGITDSWPKTLSEHHRKRICRLMSQCEEVAKGYVSSNEMRGLRIAQLLGEWPEIEGVASQPIWGSLACGKNYYLNSHLDDDFFYSLSTLASSNGLRQDIDRYTLDVEVCNYFAFPEQGIAVALRPGDMFLFNPRYYHSLSSRTSSYLNHDVFCLSLYLKTAVVGQNNNTLP